VHGSVHASYLHWPVSRRSLPDWFGGCRVTFHLVGRIGLRQTRERLSLGYLLDLMEDVQADVAALDLTRPDLPSIGVSGDIRVRPEQRTAFLDELQRTLQDLFTRYGGAEGDAFRLAVACYPKGDPDGRA
jgi:hypothetical protein